MDKSEISKDVKKNIVNMVAYAAQKVQLDRR